jgi:hypothetical protein
MDDGEGFIDHKVRCLDLSHSLKTIQALTIDESLCGQLACSNLLCLLGSFLRLNIGG